MAKRQQSEQARAAKMIRTQLKAAFPHTKFSVTSESFAGGNAVHTSWKDGPTSKQVDEVLNRYQFGSFDGMQDLYEYTNTRDDIPQAKYVHGQRSYSPAAYDAIVPILNSYWGWSLVRATDKYSIVTRESDVFMPGQGMQSHEINRTLQYMSLVCGYCKHGTLPGDKFCPDCGASLDAADAIVAAELAMLPA